MASPVKFPKEEPEQDITNHPPLESSKDKFWRKMKEQPAVPIGSLLTCGALIAASNHLRKGNRDQFQKALRWRVGLQGVTVLAAVAGSMYYGAAAMQPSSSGEGAASSSSASTSAISSISVAPGRPATNLQASRAEEKREADRAQLAERLREAMQREKELQEKEEIFRQLAAEEGQDAAAAKDPRLRIGKDSRWSWRKGEQQQQA